MSAISGTLGVPGEIVRGSSLIGMASAAALFAAPAVAQDVTGIANADVRAGYRSVSLRLGYLTPDDGKPAVTAAQAAYQRNLSDKFSVQGALLFSRVADGPVAFRGVQTQVQWQVAEDEEAGIDAALMAIARIPDGDDGPARTGLVAALKWVRDDWEARALLASIVEVGDRARDGVLLTERAEVTRRIGDIGRLGVQTSNSFNSTADFGAFKDQNHQLGPVFKLPVGRLLMTGVALFGISAAAPDVETKVFLTWEL